MASWSADGSYIGRIWFFRDITDRKRAEIKLQRANRALKTLSACGTAVIHATDEEALYASSPSVCRPTSAKPILRCAWAGMNSP